MHFSSACAKKPCGKANLITNAQQNKAVDVHVFLRVGHRQCSSEIKFGHTLPINSVPPLGHELKSFAVIHLHEVEWICYARAVIDKLTHGHT